MKRLLITIIFLPLLILSCKKEEKVVKPLKVEFEKNGELSVYKKDSDSLISNFNIEIADDAYETQTGLMNRHSMEDDQAMLFVFPNVQPRSFYMKNTYIPLDIIFIDEHKVIVSIQKNAKPLDERSLPSGLPAKYVLEIKAELTDKYNIDVGDYINYTTKQ